MGRGLGLRAGRDRPRLRVDPAPALEALGDSFLLLRVNRATTSRGDVRANAFVRLEGEDMAPIAAGAPSVEALSPKANNWFIQAFRGDNISRVTAIGVEPDYADIVHVPLARGPLARRERPRPGARRSACIGWGAREELFGDEPCVGEEIQL